MTQGLTINPLGSPYTLQANPVGFNYLLYNHSVNLTRSGTGTALILDAGAIAFNYAIQPQTWLSLVLAPNAFGLTLQNVALSYSSATQNAMGINFATGSGVATVSAGLRHWKNALRESWGFAPGLTPYGAPQVAVNSAGWPTQNFTILLWLSSYSGNIPAWATQNGGVFNCGFSGSGAETVTAVGFCSISSLVQSGGNTTFKLTVSGSGDYFGISVGNVTQAVTNQFYYLPAYNTLTGIDNPASTSSITNEAITHYASYAFIRFMSWNGVLQNTFPVTSANRSTPSNTQAIFYSLDAQTSATATNASPCVFTVASSVFAVNGAKLYLYNTGASYSAPGSPPGGFSFGTPYYVVNASGSTFNLAATSGGTPINSTSTGTTFGISGPQGDGVPQEWCAALAMAAGCGMWLNSGPIFDSTYTYHTALADALYAMVPAGVPIYLEIGDEMWNGVAVPDGANQWQTAAGGNSASVTGAYLATQLHAIAAIWRGVFGSRFGTDVRLVAAWQAGGNGVYFKNYLFATYSTNGWTVNAQAGGDLWGTSIAPYMNTGYTSGQYGNTIAQIEATLTTVGSGQGFASYLEQNTVMGLKYGLPMVCYEGGWQTNSESTSLVNAGASILDTGMTAVMENYYQAMLNSGAYILGTESGGIDTNSNTNLTPADCLGKAYPISTSNSPRFAAILASQSIVPTRNVVTAPGSTVSGGNYLDTSGASAPVLVGGTTPPFDSPNYGVNGQVSYLVYSGIARTTALSVNFTNTGSSGLTGLEWGGEFQPYQILSPTVAIPAGTNTVSIGSINIPAGRSYVTIGKPGTAQSAISINSLTFG